MRTVGKFGTLRMEMEPPVKAGWYLPFRSFLPRKILLLEELEWEDPNGVKTIIPKGVTSDGASVPLIFQALLPSRLETMEAGILHDWLCRRGVDLAWADAQFRVALRSLGVNGFYAYVMYAALRIASPWRNRDNYAWSNLFKE